jgi:AraC-like DNA-binding protein
MATRARSGARAPVELPYTEVAPPGDLAPYVDRFWLRTALTGDPAARNRVLPDGCADVIVDLGRGAARLVGTMTRALELPGAAAELIAVRFRPGAAAAIARCALAELTDRSVALAELGLADAALVDAVRDAGGGLARLAVLAAWLRGRLVGARPPEPMVGRAVAALAAPDAPRVEQVARALGVTRQHLARAFQREVGVSPKQLARIARMQRATAALGRGGEPAEVAVELGYFDQAHLARELRALAGITPAVVAVERPGALVHLYARAVPFVLSRVRRAP